MKDARTKLLAASSSVHAFEGWEESSVHPRRLCARAHARRQSGWWPDGNGMQKAKGWGGGGAFVLPKERKKKEKKSPRQICLVREPGSAAAGNSVAPVRCATSIHASQSLTVSIAFPSPFVLDENDAQGAEKSISHGGKKKNLNQKCRLKHAVLSSL